MNQIFEFLFYLSFSPILYKTSLKKFQILVAGSCSQNAEKILWDHFLTPGVKENYKKSLFIGQDIFAAYECSYFNNILLSLLFYCPIINLSMLSEAAFLRKYSSLENTILFDRQ